MNDDPDVVASSLRSKGGRKSYRWVGDLVRISHLSIVESCDRIYLWGYQGGKTSANDERHGDTAGLSELSLRAREYMEESRNVQSRRDFDRGVRVLSESLASG